MSDLGEASKKHKIAYVFLFYFNLLMPQYSREAQPRTPVKQLHMLSSVKRQRRYHINLDTV